MTQTNNLTIAPSNEKITILVLTLLLIAKLWKQYRSLSAQLLKAKIMFYLVNKYGVQYNFVKHGY